LKNQSVSKEKIAFIINPISGTRTKDNIESLVFENLDVNRFDPVILYTQHAGHGYELALQLVKEETALIVAVGGDGTVNEVARALVHSKSVLGIVPMGSGNGLARHLRIPLNPKDAIEMFNHYKSAEIDYGKANEILFFCTCGVGFDAHIGHEFSKAKTRGFLSYIQTILREFISYRPKKYKLKTKTQSIKKKAFLVTFANAAQYGNNAFIAPNADIQDGYINVSILEPFPAISVPSLSIRLFGKQFHKSRFVEVMKAKKVVLRRKKAGEFHFDGEPAMLGKRIKVKMVHKGLSVAVPYNSKLYTS
jgi:diacylglycerol kinase (ATP)